MLFVKKKPAPKAQAAQREADTLERIDTVETDVEVLAPCDSGPRQPAGRGLFVRPAKDVTDVLELAAPVSPGAQVQRDTETASAQVVEPDAAQGAMRAAGAGVVNPNTHNEPVSVGSDARAAADESRVSSSSRGFNPLLAGLARWREQVRERRLRKDEGRETSRRARKDAAATTAQAKESAKRAKNARPPADESSERTKDGRSVTKSPSGRSSKPLFGSKHRTGPAAESVLLATEFEGARTVFWRMGADSLEQLEHEPVGSALSFSLEDRRFRIEPALSRRAAQDLAMMEIGEPVSLVLAGKEHQALYATRFVRATAFVTHLVPGPQALDELLKKAGREPRNLVTGFLLKGQQNRTLALLYHVDAQGEIGALQVTANPENMDFTLAQYVASRRITPEDHDVVLFDNADLLSVATLAHSYPVEPVIVGLALSRVLQLAACTSVAAALGIGGWAGWEYTQGVQLQGRIKTMQANIKSDTARNGEFLRSSLSSFAQVMTLDTTAQLSRAQSLWLPGTTLTLQSSQSESRYQLVMPVVRGERVGTRPSVASRLTVEELVGLVDFTPPEQCRRDELAVQGALNELKVTIVCQDADTALAGYRLD